MAYGYIWGLYKHFWLCIVEVDLYSIRTAVRRVWFRIASCFIFISWHVYEEDLKHKRRLFIGRQ